LLARDCAGVRFVATSSARSDGASDVKSPSLENDNDDVDDEDDDDAAAKTLADRRVQRRAAKAARGVKAKCDPYGQQGLPLTADECAPLVATLSNRWSLSLDASTSHPPSSSVTALPPTTPMPTTMTTTPQSLHATFHFTGADKGAARARLRAAVDALCVNDNHLPLSVDEGPSAAAAVNATGHDDAAAAAAVNATGGGDADTWLRVRLHTPALAGLSYRDFMLALKIDASPLTSAASVPRR
jgi:hypothetical protein